VRTSDRERMVLIKDLCHRLGSWTKEQAYPAFSNSQMTAIREDAERLVELLDARELSLYRKRPGGPPREYSEEG
jgi:hypothetical protein